MSMIGVMLVFTLFVNANFDHTNSSLLQPNDVKEKQSESNIYSKSADEGLSSNVKRFANNSEKENPETQNEEGIGPNGAESIPFGTSTPIEVDNKSTDYEVDEIIFKAKGTVVNNAGVEKEFRFGVLKLKKVYNTISLSEPVYYLSLDGDELFGYSNAFSYAKSSLKGDQFLRELLIVLYSERSRYEVNIVLNEDGSVDFSNSKIAEVPPEFKNGRIVNANKWSGKYYRKGSTTEFYEPKRNEGGELLNADEQGDPVFELTNVTIPYGCYDYGRSIEKEIPRYYEVSDLCTTYQFRDVGDYFGDLDIDTLGLRSISESVGTAKDVNTNKKIEHRKVEVSPPTEQTFHATKDDRIIQDRFKPKEIIRVEPSPEVEETEEEVNKEKQMEVRTQVNQEGIQIRNAIRDAIHSLLP